MRNKHLELRRRIEDTKLAITDAELFGARLYGAVDLCFPKKAYWLLIVRSMTWRKIK